MNNSITVGFSTRKNNQYFIDLLKSTSGFKEIQVIQKINDGSKSLCEVYNEILNESINDIVVFCHDDILFEKPYWGKRLIEHFNKNKDFGIIGVAGTKFLSSSGRWWEIQSEMVGQVYHQKDGKKWLSEYNKNFGNGIIETILVDGLFFGVHKKRIKKTFNEKYKNFHFYDVSFCFENFLEGVKIGTISNIPLTHLSVGMTNSEWEKYRNFFSEEHKNNLPVLLKSNFDEHESIERLPLVSIITPIYNYGNMFHKTLESIFNSTYRNFELIIIDDGSTSEYVLKKIKSLENHKNIKIIRQDNSGPSVARNKGIKESKGKYILPLDSDDMIDPTYIQSCVNILNNNSNVSPVYCDTLHIGEMQGVQTRVEWSFDNLLKGPFIVNCSMFTKESFEISGGYDENMKGWEDYDLWIRMAKNGFVGKRIPKPLFIYFHHEKDGTVSSLANTKQQELYDFIMKKNFKNETI